MLNVVLSLARPAPDSLSSKFMHCSDIFNSYNLKDFSKLGNPLPRTNYFRNSFCYNEAVLRNNYFPFVMVKKTL